MKQHIEPEDLAQLSDKAKEKLREWWKPGEYDLCTTGDRDIEIYSSTEFYLINYDDKTIHFFGDKEGFYKKLYPLMSIGQLIMFLSEHHRIVNLFEIQGKWYLMRHGSDFRSNMYEELCSALFSAVKYILEENDEKIPS